MINNSSKIKILIFADPQSAHTMKWVNGLINHCELLLVGLNAFDTSQYDERLNYRIIDVAGRLKTRKSGSLNKARYLFALYKIKEIISYYQPDILHSFYGSSYGLLSCLTKFKPSVLSLIGSDIFDFPQKSFLHERLIKYVISNSDVLLSSSKYMAEYTSDKYNCGNKMNIVNYGIDTTKFYEQKNKTLFSDDSFVVGIIKKFEHYYGIKDLIDAFEMVRKKEPGINIKLLLVGGGDQSKIDYYKKYIIDKKLSECSKIIANVPYSAIEKMHNELDLAVYPSHRESFGVSLLESMACAVPVIASDILAFSDIITKDNNGLLFKTNDIYDLSSKILNLFHDDAKREKLKTNGTEFIKKHYEFRNNLQQQLKIYERIINHKIN